MYALLRIFNFGHRKLQFSPNSLYTRVALKSKICLWLWPCHFQHIKMPNTCVSVVFCRYSIFLPAVHFTFVTSNSSVLTFATSDLVSMCYWAYNIPLIGVKYYDYLHTNFTDWGKIRLRRPRLRWFTMFSRNGHSPDDKNRLQVLLAVAPFTNMV